jgi:hypothetical protein
MGKLSADVRADDNSQLRLSIFSLAKTDSAATMVMIKSENRRIGLEVYGKYTIKIGNSTKNFFNMGAEKRRICRNG